MSKQNILWEIIKTNLGNNSLDLFQTFYGGESIQEQYAGAFAMFFHIFGEKQAKEMLHPVLETIKKGKN